MSAEENKAMIEKMLPEFPNDPDMMQKIYTPDCVFHDNGTDLNGLEAFAAAYGPMMASMTDMKIELIGEVVASGDRAAFHYGTSFTHNFEWMGIPATGKSITILAMEIARFENGKIAERWAVYDFGGAMQALQS